MNSRNDNKTKLTNYLNYLKQDPDNLNLLISISDGYRQSGEFALAQSYLDRAKALNSEACIAQQGYIDIHLGKFEEAKQAFTKALDKENLSLIRYALAVCHYSLDEIPEGIEVLSPLLVHGSSNYEVEILMAKMMRDQYRLDEAIKLLEATIQHHGATEECYALLAEIYFDCEELELAKNAAKQTLLLAPDNYEAQIVLLLLGLTEGETTVAEINHLLMRNPEDARLWFALGTTLLRQMKLQEAEKAFEKAAELEPVFCDNWISLGWCQLFLNKLSDAKASYQKAIAIYEESPEGWGGLALVASLNTEFTDAEELIAKTRELDDQSFLADIAEIISTQQAESGESTRKFNQTFPTMAEQINAAMAIVLAEMDKVYTTVH
ncbi:MAG: tetratricopeptide repeat protein [Tatlockia sp.]|nr:tetratricopeptide repeat protein [Tatlockia sp.]